MKNADETEPAGYHGWPAAPAAAAASPQHAVPSKCCRSNAPCDAVPHYPQIQLDLPPRLGVPTMPQQLMRPSRSSAKDAELGREDVCWTAQNPLHSDVNTFSVETLRCHHDRMQ